MSESTEDGITREAQEALALSARAGTAGETAARRFLRRYYLGLGAAFGLWLIAVGAAASGWTSAPSGVQSSSEGPSG